jgi:hypothetical protein
MVQTHREIRVMAKEREQPSGLDLMADVEVDPKQRKLVWPDVGTARSSAVH